MRVAGDFFGWFFGALYILYALDTLRLSPGELGVTIAAGGVGAFAGAAVAPAFTRRLGAGRALIVSALLGAVASLAVPLATGGPITAMLCLMAAQLAGDALYTVTEIGEASLRQRVLPGAELGRAAGAFATGRGLGGVAGALIAGGLGAPAGATRDVAARVRRPCGGSADRPRLRRSGRLEAAA